MASRGHQRRKACTRKVRYPSLADAQSVIDRKGPDLADLRPYHCPHCGHWHIGHPRGSWGGEFSGEHNKAELRRR